MWSYNLAQKHSHSKIESFHKKDYNKTIKVIHLLEKIKNESVSSNEFNKEQIYQFLKKFCDLKYKQFLFESRVEVFSNGCFPLIKGILEENKNEKIAIVTKIAKIFKTKFSGFLSFFEENLQNFDEDCYSTVKKYNEQEINFV